MWASGGHVPAPTDAAAFIFRDAEGGLVLRTRISRVEGGGASPSAIGLMVRESLDPEARFGYVLLRQRGPVFERAFAARLEDGAGEVWVAPPEETAAAFPQVWLELRREEDDLVGSYSAGGTSWEEIARMAFPSPLPARLLAGPAVASRCGDSIACITPLLVTLCEVELDHGPPPGDLRFRRGDAHSSGRVNLTDAAFLMNRLFRGGPTPTCEDAADANDDGKLDLTDAVVILNHLSKSGPALPPPGIEACGPDGDPADALEECRYGMCG